MQDAFRTYRDNFLSSHTKTDLRHQLQRITRRLDAVQRERDIMYANQNDESWLKARLVEIHERCDDGGCHDWRDFFAYDVEWNRGGAQFCVCAKCELIRDRAAPLPNPGPTPPGISFSYPNNTNSTCVHHASNGITYMSPTKMKFGDRRAPSGGYPAGYDGTWSHVIKAHHNRHNRNCEWDWAVQKEHLAYLPPAGQFKEVYDSKHATSKLVEQSSGKSIRDCEWQGKTGIEWGY